jgi:DNA-binding transcriptional regulator YhcF (GntR family)
MRQKDSGARTVVEDLRERITAGLYLGRWKPGDRLPSIRDIADDEGVDRKTAAAAYRRLQQEGIVQVRARSGVFAAAPPLPAPGPLDQLYRQWLSNTYRGATALGLDTKVVLRLIAAVAEVEQLPVPVVEHSAELAGAIAAELRERLRLRAVPVAPADLAAEHPQLLNAPLVVTTPFLRVAVASAVNGIPVVDATLSSEILRELKARGRGRPIVVFVPSATLESRVALSLRHCGVDDCTVLRVPDPNEGESLAALVPAGALAILWPGTPEWVLRRLSGKDVLKPGRVLSEETLDRVQTALLNAAVRRARGQNAVAAAETPLTVVG